MMTPTGKMSEKLAMDSVAASEVIFCMKLYQTVTLLKDAGQNIFFSPFSLSTALAMTYSGAAGDTAAQMKKGLSLCDDKLVTNLGYQQILTSIQNAKKDITLETANLLYLDERLKLLEEYHAVLEGSYQAIAKRVLFSQGEPIRQLINRKVEDLTRQKIKDLLPAGSISANTSMVLVNAIYFKGDWVDKFDISATSKKPFYITPNRTVNVNMMFRKDKFAAGRIPDLDCIALELPYKGHRISMTLLLPDQKDGLSELEKKLVNYRLCELGSYTHEQEVNVQLPRFKLEESLNELEVILSKMGMTDIFNSQRADFSGITGDRSLFVSAIIHKAFLEVNEEGSEAAAATAILMSRMMVFPSQQPLVFTADHPFFFFIRDSHTQNILFVGRLSLPHPH